MGKMMMGPAGYGVMGRKKDGEGGRERRREGTHLYDPILGLDACQGGREMIMG